LTTLPSIAAVPASVQAEAEAGFSLPPSRVQRLVTLYFASLPLLWALGALKPVSYLLIFGCFAAILLHPANRRAVALAGPWFAVGASQVLSVLVNGFDSGESPLQLLGHLHAVHVTGWLMAAAAVAIGASSQISLPAMLQTVERFGLYYLAGGLAALLLSVTLPGHGLLILTPVGMLLPDSVESRVFYYTMHVYNWDSLFEIPLPRFSLFAPWPTGMGVAGVCILSISGCLRPGWRRHAARAGALLAVVLCLLLNAFLRLRGIAQLAFLSLGFSLAFLALLWERPVQEIQALKAQIESARPIDARQEVYKASWNGFYGSPVFGRGWTSEAIDTGDDPTYADGIQRMVVGTHSSISGLLYKGGVLTFGALIAAFCITGLRLAGRARTSGIARTAFTVLAALALSAVGESLEGLTVPLLMAYFWIGAALRHGENGAIAE
jgi:hypothetical protein